MNIPFFLLFNQVKSFRLRCSFPLRVLKLITCFQSIVYLTLEITKFGLMERKFKV